MTKRKWFSGSHDQSGYGASEGVGDMKPVVLNLGHRRLKAIDDVPLAVRLKAYPDTTLTEDARQIPWRIFALRYRSSSFPRSQKSRDLGNPGCGKADSSPLKRFGMTKGKEFSGIHDQRCFTVRLKAEC